MTETGTNVQATSQNAQTNLNEIPAELKAEMDKSLAGFVPGMKIESPEPAQPGEQGQQSNDNQQQQAHTEDPFNLLKGKFGWEKPEDAITEIEQLRAFKATPPAAEPIKYENPQSEQVAKALQAGKLKEVYQVLEQQERLTELTGIEINKENAERVIKMAISLENPTLTAPEVDFQYKKEYVVPKEPVQKATEDEEDFNERHKEWEERVQFIETNRVIAAKMAQPKLELAKSKIVFPTVENSVDEGYVQYLKDLEQEPILTAQTKEAYSKITPKALETKIKFTDEPNKIDFEFQHEPDQESFNKTIEVVSDFDNLLKAFTKPDGTPDREGFAKAMYFGLNAEKLLMEAMKQSKNATIKSFLPDNSGGTQRQFPQRQEMSELDKQMQASLNGFVKA